MADCSKTKVFFEELDRMCSLLLMGVDLKRSGADEC